MPLAVQQHQGGGHAQPAQVDVGGAGGEVLRQVVRVVLGAVVDGEDIHEIAQVLGGFGAQIVRADLGERGGRGRLPLDAAAGARHHHDFFNVSFGVPDTLILGTCRAGCGDQHRAEQPAWV